MQEILKELENHLDSYIKENNITEAKKYLYLTEYGPIILTSRFDDEGNVIISSMYQPDPTPLFAYTKENGIELIYEKWVKNE